MQQTWTQKQRGRKKKNNTQENQLLTLGRPLQAGMSKQTSSPPLPTLNEAWEDVDPGSTPSAHSGTWHASELPWVGPASPPGSQSPLQAGTEHFHYKVLNTQEHLQLHEQLPPFSQVERTCLRTWLYLSNEMSLNTLGGEKGNRTAAITLPIINNYSDLSGSYLSLTAQKLQPFQPQPNTRTGKPYQQVEPADVLSYLAKNYSNKSSLVTAAQRSASQLACSELHIAAVCLLPASKLCGCEVFIPHEGVTLALRCALTHSFSLTSALQYRTVVYSCLAVFSAARKESSLSSLLQHPLAFLTHQLCRRKAPRTFESIPHSYCFPPQVCGPRHNVILKGYVHPAHFL